MCSSPFFVCLVCSSSFDTIYFYLATQSSDYRAGQSFPFDISSKEQYSFLNLLSAATESFLPDKDLCYLLSGFFLSIYSGGCSLKQLMKFILFFLGHSLVFHNCILIFFRCFNCCKSTLLSVVASFSNFWQIFCQTLKRKFFEEFGN